MRARVSRRRVLETENTYPGQFSGSNVIPIRNFESVGFESYSESGYLWAPFLARSIKIPDLIAGGPTKRASEGRVTRARADVTAEIQEVR